MKSPRALLFALLARLLGTSEDDLKDADVLVDLDLHALELVVMGIKFEEIEPGSGPFPFVALAHATTVGDLVELVEAWWCGGATRSCATPRTSVM